MGIISLALLLVVMVPIYLALRRKDDGRPTFKTAPEMSWDDWFRLEESFIAQVNAAGFAVDVDKPRVQVHEYDVHDGQGIAKCPPDLSGRRKSTIAVQAERLMAGDFYQSEHVYAGAVLAALAAVASRGGPAVPDALRTVPRGPYPNWK